MTNHGRVASTIVECKSQEELDDLLSHSRRVIALHYSYAMPEGKLAEHKMHTCALALEQDNITTIAFAMINYAEFFECGERVEAPSTTSIQYTAYVDGKKAHSTQRIAELDGLIDTVL